MVDIPWFVVVALSIFVIVSGIAFIWIMRRTGISMGSHDAENIDCPITSNSGLNEKEFPLRTRKSVVVCLRSSYLAVTLGCLVCLLTTWWQVGFAGIILFGIPTIFCWRSDWIGFYVYNDGISPQSCVDSCIRQTDFHKRIVPWSEVASCQIVTVHNKYGKFVRRYLVLKDSQGKFVFDGSCSFACQEDLDRLINFIRGT